MYYAWNYQHDPRSLKIWVATAWALQSAVMLTESLQLWFYLVARHGKIFDLIAVDPSTGVQQLFARLVQLFVQWYLLQKIWQLLHTRRQQLVHGIISGVIFLICLGSSIAVVHSSIVQKSVSNIIRQAQLPAYWTIASQLTMDIYITCVLCYALRQCKSRFSRTNVIMERMVIYTINRGVLLCLLSFVCMILYPVDSRRGTLFSETVSTPESALYVNSLMAVFNVRNYLVQLEVETKHDSSVVLHNLARIATEHNRPHVSIEH
ncbi:hypothetical protein DAEQUDRAFT_519726 [Daedalea quercina L-15889]|uniref:DUF6534 domain-containing protein n=1 Tax=Daedalea quercina L-15889 TaxID=1314783 RepID=A0A165MES9_9APHY|nr:hypothetical protein DAEQUDRAFT_519726 [Daedalea quercina L-15889]